MQTPNWPFGSDNIPVRGSAGAHLAATGIRHQTSQVSVFRGRAPVRDYFGSTDIDHIAFFTGELIDDHHSLVRIMQQSLGLQAEANLVFIVIDGSSRIASRADQPGGISTDLAFTDPGDEHRPSQDCLGLHRDTLTHGHCPHPA